MVLLLPIIALPSFVSVLNCHHSDLNFMTYSAGFSFAKSDILVFGNPDGRSTTLFGMGLEAVNLMIRYNRMVV